MTSYIDYKFYKEEYGGNMPESSFKRLSIEASAYIKKNTFNRIDEKDIPNEVKLCTCSIAEQLKKLEKREGKTSESVGSWSVNYQEGSKDDKKLYDTLKNYLLDLVDKNGTPLLYRGC